MPAGRPLLFQTPEDLKKACDKYFARCDEKGKPYTIVGLAEGLGTTRETLSEYRERPEFVDILEEARGKCETWLVEQAILNKTSGPFTQFVLKNAHGYKDKTEVENKTEMKVDFKNLPDDELAKLAGINS